MTGKSCKLRKQSKKERRRFDKMPIRIDSDLPAKAILEEENVFVMDNERACTQDIRPLKIAILNLMPNKLDTELHLLRSLSNTPLQLDITFLQTESYVPTHVSESHMEKFYNYFRRLKIHVLMD